MPLLNQLFLKAIKELEKPVSESTFLDYGGGCGILSVLAKEIGFKTILYNDIYHLSVRDAGILSDLTENPVDHFIEGDIEDVARYCMEYELKPDLICSFDVIEHIYDLTAWFSALGKFQHNYRLLFMTNANPCNPYINLKIKKIQRKAEFVDQVKTVGWKENDSHESYFKMRKRIIGNLDPELAAEKVNLLAARTRGLNQPDIGKAVREYKRTGSISYHSDHPTNTCDPINGNRTENLIGLRNFKKAITGLGLNIIIVNNFYSFTENRVLNLVKLILNKLIMVSGRHNLFLSPSYTVIVKPGKKE